MGGDHKCPVCQATFTRPQHVARHMRSHTGDRPYKCQYCGDQFARSDLLSRHINKCHSNEKPPPSAPGARRKGSASASRATTSKQACDQCVQSSLPCDGCNPCAKCVQRKCRCTFVKFHRQTAPVGPGHNPRLHGAGSSSASQALSSANLQSSRMHPYSQDDLLLGPAPTASHPSSMADNLYSENFSFSPLYPSSYPSSYASSTSSSYPASSASSSRSDAPVPLASDPDFTNKYKAHTEMLRRTGLSASRSMGTASPTAPQPGSVGEWYDHVSQQDRTNRELLQDIDRQFPVFPAGTFAGPRSGYTPTGTGFTPIGFPSTGSGFTPGAGGTFPVEGMGAMMPGTYSGYMQDRRRGSADLGGSSSSEQEHGYAASDGGSSSAASSSAHLPAGYGSGEFGILHMQHSSDHGHGHGHQRRPSSASSLGHHHQQQHPSHPHQQQQHSQQQQHQQRRGYPAEFSETFGLMSLDDPNVIAGLASDGTPFFSGRNGGGVGGDGDDPNVTPMPHSSGGGGGGGGMNGNGTRGHRSNTLPTPARDALEAEWWNTYIKRTPGTGGANGASGGAGGGGNGGGGGAGGEGYRRPRVASLPSSKTPIALPERFMSSVQSNNRAGGMHLAMPPARNGHAHAHAHAPGQAGGQAGGQGGQGGGQGMHGNEDLTSYEAAVRARGAPMALSLRLPREKRPHSGAGTAGVGRGGKGKSASAGTSPQVPHLSRPGSAGGSSSLANVFGGVPALGGAQQRPPSSGSQQQHVTFAPSPMDVTSTSSTTATTTAGMNMSASPPYGHPTTAAYRMSGGAASATGSSASPSERASSVESEVGSGGSAGAGEALGLRPSFKRLPSQTLGPASAKRVLVSREEGRGAGMVGGGGEGASVGVGGEGGAGAEGERRSRRRMSAPGGSPTALTFGGGIGLE